MRTFNPAIALAALCASGCAVKHVSPYVPKHREYTLSAAEVAASQPSAGSLYQPGQSGSLFTDQRAYRVNDLVVVRVEEVADAMRTADTNIRRNSGFSADINAFLKAANASGLISMQPQLEAKLGANSGTSFDAEGSTGRTERLQANVPSLVKKVLPNGNLFIEGQRVVLVNSEENHFYISGVVRPIDIDQANTVKSGLIADAEVEFTGRGVLNDNQSQGWLARFFGWIWPF